MENSPASTGLQHHVRSISLPSWLNPQSVKVEAELSKLKAWERSVARDLLLMMKEQVQDLQSVLTRKGGDLSIGSSIDAYMSCKKKAKKLWRSALVEANGQKNRSISSDVNQHLSMVIRVLREVNSITISVLRSLLLFLAVPVSRTRSGGWSWISKLVLTGPVASERGHEVFNEVGILDIAMKSLHGGIRRNNEKIDVQMARRSLQALDACMEGLEGGLDCLFRRLIHNRVSLLNISAH
ncbi:uncharacterized protein LOC130778027 [Actinidia eriantha]|uniref:uncharacterized protein LOC130778027 n=1 Tax=Actinidia eriantha TaxID=165200 RepID=UPI00258F7E8F|nr:uncharacterized protein LOC130778027 [Actinidia eriantha]